MVDFIKFVAEKLPNGLIEEIKHTPIYDFFQWVRLKTAPRATIYLSTPEGALDLTLPESELMFKRLKRQGVHEPGLSSALSKRLDSNSVFYDVGSQYGYFIKYAQLIGVPDKQIHGFEASKFVYEVLSDQFQDDDVQLNHCWVGKDTGGETLAIDDYASSHEPPTLVKIDVEGAEYEILQGMKKTLQKHEPLLYIEVHPQFLPKFGHNDNDLIDTLLDSNYKLDMLDHRSTQQNWKPVSDSDRPNDDAYLIRAEITE